MIISNKKTTIVWHGSQEKYQIFGTIGGRFNSEFGMEAFPHLETIKYFVEDSKDLYPQSHVIDFHNKADGHERRLATYLVENLRTATDLEVSILVTLPTFYMTPIDG
jgi:beta-mannosidase